MEIVVRYVVIKKGGRMTKQAAKFAGFKTKASAYNWMHPKAKYGRWKGHRQHHMEKKYGYEIRKVDTKQFKKRRHSSSGYSGFPNINFRF